MRTIPADQITAIAAANKIIFSGPNIDGYVMPDNPAEIYAAGQQSDVPLLLASVGNDIFSKNAVTDARTLARLYPGGAGPLWRRTPPLS